MKGVTHVILSLSFLFLGLTAMGQGNSERQQRIGLCSIEHLDSIFTTSEKDSFLVLHERYGKRYDPLMDLEIDYESYAQYLLWRISWADYCIYGKVSMNQKLVDKRIENLKKISVKDKKKLIRLHKKFEERTLKINTENLKSFTQYFEFNDFLIYRSDGKSKEDALKHAKREVNTFLHEIVLPVIDQNGYYLNRSYEEEQKDNKRFDVYYNGYNEIRDSLSILSDSLGVEYKNMTPTEQKDVLRQMKEFLKLHNLSEEHDNEYYPVDEEELKQRQRNEEMIQEIDDLIDFPADLENEVQRFYESYLEIRCGNRKKKKEETEVL
jgi:hypothetical protein